MLLRRRCAEWAVITLILLTLWSVTAWFLVLQLMVVTSGLSAGFWIVANRRKHRQHAQRPRT